MAVSVRHVQNRASLYVDGRRVEGLLELKGGVAKITLNVVPTPGMHLLQMQNPNGLFSNDFIFYVKGTDTRASAAGE